MQWRLWRYWEEAMKAKEKSVQAKEESTRPTSFICLSKTRWISTAHGRRFVMQSTWSINTYLLSSFITLLKTTVMWLLISFFMDYMNFVLRLCENGLYGCLVVSCVGWKRWNVISMWTGFVDIHLIIMWFYYLIWSSGFRRTAKIFRLYKLSQF